jgi:hypothetical protein
VKFVVRLATFLILTSAASQLLSQQSSDDLATRKAIKGPDSFADFALKQLNPQNTDYGCRLDNARKLAVHETFKAIDFWTATIAFSFLVLSFLVLLHQRRESDRREIIAAQLLAQYHNNWVDARKKVQDTIGRYNELVDATNNAAEAIFHSRSWSTQSTDGRAIESDRSWDVKPQATATDKVGSSDKSGANGPGQHASVRHLKASTLESREPDIDLIAQISTLQQQLIASHEREKSLQRQISKAQVKVHSKKQGNTDLAS